jgi:hypothetical protein
MIREDEGIERLRRLAQHAERRIRLDRSLRVGATTLAVALLVCLLATALRKLGVVPEWGTRLMFGLAAAAVATAAFVAWTARLPEHAGARALDRFHALNDRIASALAFSTQARGEPSNVRTPFMDAAIEDAVAAARDAEPTRAVPLATPRAAGLSAGLAVALLALVFFEVRHHVPRAHAKTIDALEMAPDDLDDVRDFLAQVREKDSSDDTRAAIDEFNRLVEDIAKKRLDRTDAFRQMQALDNKLLSGQAADRKALEQQLERIGEELKRAELTKPAGEALSQAKLHDAEDALRDLAKKMRAGPAGSIDKAKLDQLRQALKKAAEDAERRRQELEKRRDELADEILKMKQRVGDGGSDEERSLLEKKQRELERLDRNVDEQKNAGRQLDRLDRELEQAAEDLMKDLGLSARDLEQGAEDLNRMEQSEMTQQEKEELRQKLQELRELVRQQGQGAGKQQVVRLKRFGRLARGQGGQGGQQGQGGEQGGPQANGEDQGAEGQSGQGQNGEGQNGQQDGQGRAGGGQGGETWILGPNGEKMLLLSQGSGMGQGNGGGGEGTSSRGNWGEGHDPKLQGGATNPKMGTQDTQVQGADTGQGPSRSQVILGASERGFASHGYRKVYTEYHQVAEESLAKDEIPGGYRFYVKRYFQLIRPREPRDDK